MTNTLRIKRRAVGGAAGAPASLAAAEIAYNEQDDTLYYGKGNSGGNATSVLPIAGPGAFQAKDGDLTALAGLAGTNTIYYRSGTDTWAAVNVSTGLAFSGGNLTATSAGGNVSNSGTPTVGQYAKWVTGVTIQGVAPATVLSDIGAAAASSTITSVVIQKFTASGTYTPTASMKYCIIECIGGGGGGGGTINSSGGGFSGTGGGGGAGGYSRTLATAAAIGASKTVTIGALGGGGAGGNNPGSAGGDTSVGVLCVAKGGSGGGGGSSGLAAVGAGGVAGTGDIAAPGQSGEPGLAAALVLAAQSGRGGSTAYGSGGASLYTITASPGLAATGYGCGGSGGSSYGAAGAASGGNGSAGLVIITEYV